MSPFICAGSCCLIFYTGLLIALVLLLLCGIVLYEGRIDARERSIAMQNLAMASWDIERNIEIYSLSLQAVVEGERPRGRQAADTAPLPGAVRPCDDRQVPRRDLRALDAKGDIEVDGKSDDAAQRPTSATSRTSSCTAIIPTPTCQPAVSLAAARGGGSPSIRSADHEARRRVRRRRRDVDPARIFQNLFSRACRWAIAAIALITRTAGCSRAYDPKIVGRDISHASMFRRFADRQ